jgi:hypothetical protein
MVCEKTADPYSQSSEQNINIDAAEPGLRQEPAPEMLFPLATPLDLLSSGPTWSDRFAIFVIVFRGSRASADLRF